MWRLDILFPLSFTNISQGPSWLWLYGSWIYNYLCKQCLSPLMLWVRFPIRARCTTCDKVCQWIATSRWFSPGPPVSSTNKTDRHPKSKSIISHLSCSNQWSHLLPLSSCIWHISCNEYSWNTACVKLKQ